MLLLLMLQCKISLEVLTQRHIEICAFNFNRCVCCYCGYKWMYTSKKKITIEISCVAIHQSYGAPSKLLFIHGDRVEDDDGRDGLIAGAKKRKLIVDQLLSPAPDP